MSTSNPSNNIRKKSSKKMTQLASGSASLPAFSAPNAADTEKNHLQGFGNDQNEIQYLKRLALRAQLSAYPAYNSMVPSMSEMEVQTSYYLNQLNTMNSNPQMRLQVTALCSRFNSTSMFNIAQELATLRMNRESVLEVEALIDGGVDAWLDNSTGPSSNGAYRASGRAYFAAQAPRS